MLERDSEVNGVEVRGLALSRGGRALFAGLSFTLSPGEAVVVSGPNGAGKTSLLRAVAGLLRPDAGAIAFPGADTEAARERGLHFLGHHDGLKSARTAGEELAFWTRWLGGSAMEAAVEAFELGPLLRMEVRRLSAGQRRRVSLARLLAAPRPLWLLDEPLAPLDAARRARFGEILAQHLAEGGMVLAAAHDPLPILAQTLDLTPFPLDGGRAGDGGEGTTIDVRAREATPFREPPPPLSTSRPAHTPNPDPSPIEGEGRHA